MHPNLPFVKRMQKSLEETMLLHAERLKLPNFNYMTIRSQNVVSTLTTVIFQYLDGSCERVLIEFDDKLSVTMRPTRLDFRIIFLTKRQMISDGIWQHHTYAMSTSGPEITGTTLAGFIVGFAHGHTPTHQEIASKLHKVR